MIESEGEMLEDLRAQAACTAPQRHQCYPAGGWMDDITCRTLKRLLWAEHCKGCFLLHTG